MSLPSVWRQQSSVQRLIFLAALGFLIESSSKFAIAAEASAARWLSGLVAPPFNTSPFITPTITTQPQSQTAVAGATVTFTVVATGTPPLRFQWLFNGAVLAGATNQLLVLTNLQPSQAGNYSARVSNAAGTVTSATALLRILDPPRITAQPQNQTVPIGFNATFNVIATGTLPLRYQWLLGARDLAGATNATLIITNVQPANAGSYSVRVSNATGSVVSTAALLSVPNPPRIITQPQGQIVAVGGTATFRVDAAGALPLRYQWLFNTRDLLGATNAALVISNVQLTNAGNYSVLITNLDGRISSAPARLEVTAAPSQPPIITAQPQSQTVALGATVNFIVTAIGTPPLLYQWTFNGANLPRATNALLVLTNVQPANAGAYAVRVRNAGGSVDSAVARLSLNLPPVITAQPQSQSVAAGSNATFVVRVTSATLARYQWLFNGRELAGATNVSLRLTNSQPSNAGNYSVRVSNVGGTVTSQEARLTVNPLPAITGQPQSQTVTAGATVTFRVTATGTAPLRYQWFLAGKELAGATNSSLTITNVQAVHAGSYSVRVRDAVSEVFSASAELRVNAPTVPPTITRPPQSVTNLVGASVTFVVQATGTLPLLYQWRFNGADIARATNSLLILTNVQPASAGSYSVRVSNAAGTVTSAAALLSLSTPPGIAAQPRNQIVAVGGTANFTVNASGPGPFAYQWFFNGQIIPGATNAALVITNVQAIHAGSYTARVSNASGSVSSSPAQLTLPPVITRQPQSVSAPVGAGVTLTVQASGTPPLLYQWRFEGQDLPRATNAFLILTNLQPANFGRYTVRVSNSGGSVTSDEARLSLSPPPAITAQPRDQTVNAGGTAFFTVTASGEGLLRYQWRFNGADIARATNATLVVTNVQAVHVGNYTVRVSNAAGAVLSSAARLSLSAQAVPPAIAGPPQNLTVTVGGRAAFLVQATGTAPLQFQWRFNGRDLAGATNALLVLTNAQLANAGAYSVRVSNAAGAVISTDATLTVNPASVRPTITSQPQSRTVNAGATVVFSVVAAGTPPLQYQWRFANKNLFGATNATLTLTKVQAANAGTYSVRVSNAAGQVFSANADLAVTVPPVITVQPQSQSTLEGAGTIIFRVTATGTGPLRYQWRFNGRDLAGQTNTALVLTPVRVENAGIYTVRVTNSAGSVSSAEARLTINLTPVITSQPSDRSVPQTGTAAFSVGATGTAPLRVQWLFNGRDLPGATNALLLITNAQPTNEGTYSARVTNTVGAATSRAARLTVIVPPRIVTPPQSQTAVRGATARFNVTASGSAPLAYQWHLNGRELAGATNATLTVADVQLNDLGNYKVTIRNAAGVVTSPIATLFVTVPPAILKQPESQSANPGSGVGFFVKASGTLPLQYQWRFNGRDISGATNTALLLPNVQTANAGTYNVVVRNSAGSTTSADARLTLNAPPSIQTHPTDQTVAPGASVTFRVVASGDPPLRYQWLKNGALLLGANTGSADFTISNVQFNDSGAYGVIVANRSGAVTSRKAILRVSLSSLSLADHFADMTTTTVESGSFDGGDNRQATREPSEPTHAFARGGKSVWFAWQAPASGIANFSTAGSEFDTLLAIYTGNRVEALTGVASDNDRGGFKTSSVNFNAVAGTLYRIAIDGAAGAAGRIVISWRLQATQQRIPRITTHPVSQTVRAGADVTFSVATEGSGALSHQWFYNNSAITGATGTNYVLRNAQAENAGHYTVKVSSDPGGQFVSLTVESLPAVLQINAGDPEPQKVAASDKFQDLFELTPPGSVGLLSWPARTPGRVPHAVARGYSGAQVFNTFGATKEDGEPNHCDEIGGASQWFLYQPPTNGVLRVSTEGSEFDTVLAVYTGPGTDFATLRMEACNDNVSTNASFSFLTLPVLGGTNYYIAVDGVDGVQGQVELSYDLGQAPRITAQPASQSVAAGTNVTLIVAAMNPLASAPFSYQWRKDESDVSGATNATFVLSNVQPVDGGNYSVIVASDFGAVTSAVATVTIAVPIAIASPPVDQAANVGQTAVFSVTANGSEPLSYQWFFKGAAKPGETNATLTLPKVLAADAGDYHVVIANPAGSVISPSASLTVGIPPQIVAQPQSTNALAGATISLSITVSGAEPLTYQWRFADQEIAGATNSTLTLADLQPAMAGSYEVAVSNSAGTTVSSAVLVGVNTPVAILADPQNQTAVPGTNVTLSVTATGTAPLAFQWQFNGVDIPAATNAVLALAKVEVENAGSYRVLVSNAFSSEASEEAELVLLEGDSPSVSLEVALEAGAVVIRMSGRLNDAVELQVSTDLINWQALATLTLASEVTEHRDTQAGGLPHRFYRAVVRE